ncbi:glycine cleavage system aminomethyltransferase GcvT [Clostridium sp. MSJ-4]|uniref:Aminomethyltransferase n=1 Tax=Clostridium simiarum TaxID=2841506 RepID=A0ABS6F0D8_9CLOT|nr:glycine cleavage system aminomethyltransferase GcvT [Clostridium simiarum]MBU5591962.1 glycine cleavage system aminomethyltransferase GcvT [Clostridium simiarum]
MENLRKTPLIDLYGNYGGKVVDYAGWALPVEFEGLIPEHEAVRNQAGLFDVSHMGEISVKGKDALKFLQHIMTNDISILEKNQVVYTLMCYENGGVVDDLILYKFDEEDYFLVVNASNVDKDFQWILDNKEGFNIEIENLSPKYYQLALQGPKAEEILQRMTDTNLSQIKFFYFERNAKIKGIDCLVSRTGYTGEDGFEIYTTNHEGIKILWDEILKEGKEDGVKPIGLGARDTLRFEANLPLYGNEISQDITPLEGGLGFFVKLNKEEFIGKEVLVKQKSEGLKRKVVGFEMIDRGIARHGYTVLNEGGEEIGVVTTGYYSPTLKKNIGLALIKSENSEIGKDIFIQVRNRKLKANIINKRFYTKKTKSK